ncbi:transketolase [Clostridium magnum]|uniref:Transketolase n=1 Tax=Clostridium magnum DSM 2767 TaxID=1121326 RepID=A0A162QUP9_9CLOT|nr:transketolase [Clostridium magnum]KZL88993.1 transketolase [Clostridium magnum DSM 2767]SHI23432.1 transketolase [Clostridium magnum DSM 2767]
MSNIDNLSVNIIRALSADAVQKANSGHPGLPLGAAPMAYELWAKHMKHNPKDPKWSNRDRFILSAGHGSALLYSLLHLFGYGGLSIDDLSQFRQSGSLTPGHPEYGHTVGVETTTGPLGAGMATAVGMAIAERYLSTKFNKEGYPIVDYYTFVLGGDGCMMEGISSEAFSLAGTLELNKLIVLYDSNKITIEGDTDIAFTEDIQKRFEAYGFQILIVEDGNSLEKIGAAIEAAKEDKSRPSLIIVKTKIGYGCPAKEGKASAHGEPLGEENVKALKEYLKLPANETFHVPGEVYEHFKKIASKNIEAQEKWNEIFERYCNAYPEMKKLWNQYYNLDIAKELLENEEFWSYQNKPDSTRNISGMVINRLKDLVPGLIGGSADLAPSTKTYMKNEGDFSKDNYGGRNLHFGVRELAMAGIGNGLALSRLHPYVSTFFVFSDYVKPMARLSSLMKLPLIYVLTHDSIGVGEDGPTHEPIEQLAMLRSQPNFTVFRPADATETIAGWYHAITSQKTPTALVLSRQNLPQLLGSSKAALKGGYIIAEAAKDVPDAIIIASGSEVELAIKSKEQLEKEGIYVRVVSMPSMEIFEVQSKEYKESVLPKGVRARVAVEAAAEFGWGKYVGIDGAYVTMQGFGASAPAADLFEEFGFTTENVIAAVKSVL